MYSSKETDDPKHSGYMQKALTEAKKSPPAPMNFCVGAVLVDSATDTILATGYTLECPGNTHAEQCCFIKYAAQYNMAEERLEEVLPKASVLYTTMEPCALRLSANLPCVDRILMLGKSIKTVYVGVLEPPKFVSENTGKKKLNDAGIKMVKVVGLEDEILKVATAGHARDPD